jgi:flagellar L-ring protein precursor FlgH
MKAFRIYFSLPGGALFVMLLAACATTTPPTATHQPMSARPAPVATPAVANGAIYQARNTYRTLFEDFRARNIGDSIIVNLNEQTAASKNSNSAAEKQGSLGFSIPTFAGLPGKALQGAGVTATSDNKFGATGASGNNNNFTGTITVTVIDVFPNGNLLVSGEKQIGINQGSEYIRFSGVVSPATIQAGNQVASTQVADARIEYRGAGYIDDAQKPGFVQRIFMSVLPF